MIIRNNNTKKEFDVDAIEADRLLCKFGKDAFTIVSRTKQEEELLKKEEVSTVAQKIMAGNEEIEELIEEVEEELEEDFEELKEKAINLGIPCHNIKKVSTLKKKIKEKLEA